MRRIFSFFVIVVLLCTSFPCLADPSNLPVIVPLTKGQPAPFVGVLLTPEAVAKVIAETKDCKQRIKVESDRARDMQKVEDDKHIADVLADTERDKKIFQANITSRDGQIKDLTSALQNSENARKNLWLWVGGGALAGTLLTIGTVILISYAK